MKKTKFTEAQIVFARGAVDLRTPHIDSLFKGGIRFTNFYANSPVCSPSRAALLSGCYPERGASRA